MADVQLKAVITAEDDASKTINSVSESLKASREGLLAVGAAAGIAFAGIASFTKDAIDAANEHAKVEAQLTAVLTSTKGAAGLTADAANELAESFQRVTTFDNDAVLSVENMLLTFTKVGKDVMPQATEAVLNMATALGEDSKDAAIQLGKALNDPVLGITALHRVGVEFSQDQKDVIKSLVDTGNIAGAQKIILDELNTEFGGSARAAAQTFGGAMEQLQNQVSDVEKEIGQQFIPIIQSITQHITPLVEKFADWSRAHPELVRNILLAGGALTGLTVIMTGIGLVLPSLIAGFGLLLGPFGLILAAVVALIAIFTAFHTQIIGFVATINQSTGIISFFKAAWDAIVVVFQQNLMPALKNLWEALQPLTPFLKALGEIIGFVLVAAIYIFIGVVTGLIILLTQLLTWFTQIETFIVNFFVGALNKASGAVSALIDWWPKFQKAVGDAVGAVVGFFQPFLNVLDSIISKLSAVGNAIGNVAGAVGGAVSSAVHAIIPHAQGGTVHPNSTYLVGENGPEIFTSNVGGSILPAAQLSGAGGGNITVNISGGYYLSDRAANDMADTIIDRLRRKTRVGI